MIIRKLYSGEEPPFDLLLAADPSLEHIEEYLNRGECFIAEDEEGLKGVYILLSTRYKTAELVNISVVASQQGKGIGKKLLRHAIWTAKEKEFKTIEIGTGNSSLSQLALYQKYGFRIIGVDVDFFIKHYTEEIFENGIQCRDMIRLSQDL